MKMKSIVLGGACLAGAALLTRAVLRNQRKWLWKNRVVIITGGSRGLGLVMARQLVAVGAHVAICSRTEHELDRARQDLGRRGGIVFAQRCDVTQAADVQAFVRSVKQRFGRIDALINNAGIIRVGPFETMDDSDYESALATHFWGPYHFTQAVLPIMKSQGGGRIANIASIGGQVSLPHLNAYSTSKFALVGFSRGLRAELASAKILVTTVCPHLMRTGSHQHAQFKGQHRAEFAWFSLGATLPLVSMGADNAARGILSAVEYGDAELTLTVQGNIAARLFALFPSLGSALSVLANRILPASQGGRSMLTPGKLSHSWLSPSVLTTLGDRAAIANNETA